MQYRIKVFIVCPDLAHRGEWVRRLKDENREGQAGTELGFVLTWEPGSVAVFTFPPTSYRPSKMMVEEKIKRALQFAGHQKIEMIMHEVVPYHGATSPRVSAIPMPRHTRSGYTIH